MSGKITVDSMSFSIRFMDNPDWGVVKKSTQKGEKWNENTKY